jgi:uncharacterized protein YbaP (TraB family)
MIRTLLATSAALLLTACSSGLDLADLDQDQLRDEPIMFSVTDDDSEVILFGTFHLLPEGVEWESQTLSDAIARADEVWFEIPKGAEADPALQQLAVQLGLSDTPLSQRLDAQTLAKLETELDKLGLPLANVDSLQPWLASLSLSQIQMASAGFDPNAGVEAVLAPRVDTLPRKAFEAGEQQLRFLADMDEAAQIDMLASTLDGMDEGVDLLTRMAQSWATGDVDMLEEEVVAAAKSETPVLYDVMFTRRNADWTEQLVAELEGSGTDFVAVGAGHLLGPDSVPVMLEARGYDVQVLTADK